MAALRQRGVTVQQVDVPVLHVHAADGEAVPVAAGKLDGLVAVLRYAEAPSLATQRELLPSALFDGSDGRGRVAVGVDDVQFDRNVGLRGRVLEGEAIPV